MTSLIYGVQKTYMLGVVTCTVPHVYRHARALASTNTIFDPQPFLVCFSQLIKRSLPLFLLLLLLILLFSLDATAKVSVVRINFEKY